METGAQPVRSEARAAGWFRDPLDPSLVRFWNGSRWTFETANPAPVRKQRSEPTARADTQREVTPPTVALRDDIESAKKRVKGALVGAGKEIRLLTAYLHPEEKVLALAPAVGSGTGVLACTNQRLLFLFSGWLQQEFLEVYWNEAREVVYDERTKKFAVYTVKVTKRAKPAFVVTVASFDDAKAIAFAAEAASAAPRLDVV